MKTIGPVVSEIICLIKIHDGRQTNRRTDRRKRPLDNKNSNRRQTQTDINEGPIFPCLRVLKRRENVEITSRRTDGKEDEVIFGYSVNYNSFA